MIGIVAALHEEVYEVISPLSFTKTEGIYHYTGDLFGKKVSLYLCGAGLKRKNKFIRWYTQFHFDYLINIGFAGALRSGYKAGDVLVISRVKQDGNKRVYDLPPILNYYVNCDISSSKEPIFSLEDKEELYYKTNCELVDMESYPLMEILTSVKGGKNKIDLKKLILLKIVGDAAEDALHLKEEVLMRSFFKRKHLLQKLSILKRMKIANFWFLYKRKRSLQKALSKELENIFKFL